MNIISKQSTKEKENGQSPRSQRFYLKQTLKGIGDKIDIFFMIKLICILSLVSICALFSNYNLDFPEKTTACIRDKVFELTENINWYFQNVKSFREVLCIVSSALIDILFVVSLIHWAFYSNSWRLMFAFGMFYGVRGVLQVRRF